MELRILMEEIFPISLKLNFTPINWGGYGLILLFFLHFFLIFHNFTPFV